MAKKNKPGLLTTYPPGSSWIRWRNPGGSKSQREKTMEDLLKFAQEAGFPLRKPSIFGTHQVYLIGFFQPI